jgi:hypothetical protein
VIFRAIFKTFFAFLYEQIGIFEFLIRVIMKLVVKLSLLYVFSMPLFVDAQQTEVYLNEKTEFNQAIILYKDKQFQAATNFISKVDASPDIDEYVKDKR